MRNSTVGLLVGVCLFVAVGALSIIGAQHFRKATLAPHELHEGDAPPPIVWEPPRRSRTTCTWNPLKNGSCELSLWQKAWNNRGLSLSFQMGRCSLLNAAVVCESCVMGNSHRRLLMVCQSSRQADREDFKV